MLLRDEFLGTVSHELRTPLNAILGWAQILQSGPRTADALQSGLATIARNARLQTQLIDDLLDLSRMSAGRLRLDAQASRPLGVVRRCGAGRDTGGVGTQRRCAAGRTRRCRARERGCRAPPAGVLEPARERGEVHRAGRQGARSRWNSGEGHHRVRVSDTGKGIAADFLPHVFDRFRQADGSTTRRHSGLGIGLALVRQLVETARRLGARREPRRGPGRHVHRAAADPACGHIRDVEPAARRLSPCLCPAPGLTVLVVDDDQDARDVASHFLEGSGARVITAASADEGLRLLRHERPDVLVADIGMPGTDGYDVHQGRARACLPMKAPIRRPSR